jgi:hypothetical protein
MISQATSRWHVGIGDPTVIGWVTVVAYAAACLLCFMCKKYSTGDYYSKQEAKFWLTLTIILALLCINKQLDLQSLLTQIGRDLANSEGWYQNRRIVQAGFITSLIIAAAGTLLWLFITVQELCVEIKCAALGIVALSAFVVIRAASFHNMDAWIHTRWLGAQMNWIMELGGIALIGVPAYIRLNRK